MVANIEQTTDYNRFKVLAHNRKIYSGHVAQLKEALKVKPEALKYNPILVNENYEVVDGQHRLQALTELGFPVYYIVGQGLTIQDAQRMNALQRNWGPLDYAQSFAEAGDEHYQRYLEFKDQYRLSHNVLLVYMGMTRSGADSTNRAFKLGMFKVGDIEVAHRHCQMLLEVGNIYADYRIGAFAVALLSLMTHPAYNHKRLLVQMEKHGRRFLTKFSNVQDYQWALERVYNYNRGRDSQIKVF